MAQDWTDDVYALTNTGSTDLQNMENNFTALKSSFSGASAPSNNVAGQLFFDTANTILKIRNTANSAWIGIMYATALTKIWVYSNLAEDGWDIDDSITDRVLAIKGGSQAYDANGGTLGGSWQQPSHILTAAENAIHTHSGTTAGRSQNHTHTSAFSAGSAGASPKALGNFGTGTTNVTSGNSSQNHTHTYTTTSQSGTGGSAHDHGLVYRPQAAIGTLQFLLLS
jgi:hypothetical protein